MAIYTINRYHESPDSEEHAAMCFVGDSVNGDFNAVVLRMTEMVMREEKGNVDRLRIVLAGLMAAKAPEPGHFLFFSHDSIAWSVYCTKVKV